MTAFHEAGHTLTSILTKHTQKLHKVTILPRGRSGGAVRAHSHTLVVVVGAFVPACDLYQGWARARAALTAVPPRPLVPRCGCRPISSMTTSKLAT